MEAKASCLCRPGANPLYNARAPSSLVIVARVPAMPLYLILCEAIDLREATLPPPFVAAALVPSPWICNNIRTHPLILTSGCQDEKIGWWTPICEGKDRTRELAQYKCVGPEIRWVLKKKSPHLVKVSARFLLGEHVATPVSTLPFHGTTFCEVSHKHTHTSLS